MFEYLLFGFSVFSWLLGVIFFAWADFNFYTILNKEISLIVKIKNLKRALLLFLLSIIFLLVGAYTY